MPYVMGQWVSSWGPLQEPPEPIPCSDAEWQRALDLRAETLAMLAFLPTCGEDPEWIALERADLERRLAKLNEKYDLE